MTSKRATLIWGVLTILVLASLVGIWLWRGALGFESAIQSGPYTNLPVTLASVATVWLLGGLFLYLLSSKRIDPNNALTWAGFFLVALVYLNLLRERTEYGDVEYYIDAAFKLAVEGALPIDYYYPPLWATLLAWLAPLGRDGLFLMLWLFNLLGLFGFYFLLAKTLAHYGFSSHLAALVTAGFMLANAPVLRTLVYMQINLHVLNAVFLSLLLYRRFPALSALTIAVAVHLKLSPAVLVLAFLLEWNWRWLAWAGLSFLVVGAIPLATYGTGPYLDFIRNTLLLTAGHGLSFRENSFEGLLMALSALLKLSPAFISIGTNIARALLLIATILVMRKNIQRETFFSGEGTRLYNAIPALLILMTLAAPVLWVHHGVFLALSFLVLLKKLDSPSQWFLFGFAYFFEYLLPTFDFFPWSYGRLAAPLICLWLLWRMPAQDSSRFEKTNRWFESLPKLI
ncbi:MAG: glycosyltransferase family 87 protein [Anaerolineae bacterium]|nr:glycosyltransferase family 87 protein [Anaerolineae bacterium]